MRGGKIYKIDIYDSYNTHLSLRDSLNLLPMSLNDLGKSFINRSKLDINPIFTLERISKEKYFIIKYLTNDIEMLRDIIISFENMVNESYNMICHNNLTSTSLSYKIFKKYYLKTHKIEVPKTYYDKFIRRAYYGGRCEVYKPTNDSNKIFHYDFNSHYPSSMLNKIPTKISGWKSPQIWEPIDPYTIYDVVVNIEKQYIPSIPFRDKDNTLKFPSGTFRTNVTGVELKYSIDNKYANIVKIYKSLKLKDPQPIFREYVLDMFSKRQEAKMQNRPSEILYKLNMNSLYGRFAMKNESTENIFVNKSDIESLNKYIESEEFRNFWEFGEKYLVEVSKTAKGVRIPESASYVSTYVTSYARIVLHEAMMGVLDRGGNVYYCDTDSIVTNLRMEESNTLGGLKLEDTYSKAYFIAPKLYGCLNIKSLVKLRGKGIINTLIKSRGLSWFEEEYNKINDTTHEGSFYKIYRSFVRSLRDLRIYSRYKPYTLTFNENKRIRIVANKKWVDTKPININNNE